MIWTNLNVNLLYYYKLQKIIYNYSMLLLRINRDVKMFITASKKSSKKTENDR